MTRDGSCNLLPFFASIKMMNLQESLVSIRGRGDQRRLTPDHTVTGNPIVGITPAVFREPWGPALLQFVKEVDGSLQISFIVRNLKKKGETHRVVGIGDRKSCRLMKKPSR